MSSTKRIALGDRVKAAGKAGGTRRLEGYISADEIDRQDERVSQSGLMNAWARAPHKALPLLWQHDREQPIGTLADVRMMDGRAYGTAELLRDGVSPAADLAWELLTMSPAAPLGFSIGFKPITAGDIQPGKMAPDGVWEWTNFELLETSVVSVPAVASSLAVAVKAFEAGADYSRPWLPAEAQAAWQEEVKKAAELADVRRKIAQARAKNPRWRNGNDKRAGRKLRSAVELASPFARKWYGGTFLEAAHEVSRYHEQRKGETLSTDELAAMVYLLDGAQHEASAERFTTWGIPAPDFPDFDTWRKRKGLVPA